MPLTATPRIVYADPILTSQLPQPKAQLTMPALTAQEPVQAIYIPITPIAAPSLSYGLSNGYTPGQCTYGVASRVSIPNDWGNANTWAYNAALQGYVVSLVPKPGSIAQTTGDSYAGHVALVESVNLDGSFVIWEENGINGPFTTDERTTTTAEFQNFIYL